MTKKSPSRDTVTDLFRSFAGQVNTLTIPRPYIDLCGGDHLSALLLSQILYWSDRTEDANGWFAKSYEEWHEELAMTEYQIKRAINGDKRNKNIQKALKDFGVESKLKPSKFHSGAATLHYRVNIEKLQQTVIDFVQNAVLNNVQNAPQTLLETPPKQSSELYTETIPETISEIISAKAGRPIFEAVAFGCFELTNFKGLSQDSCKRIGLLESVAKSMIATRFPTITDEQGALLISKFCAAETFKPNLQGKPKFEMNLAAWLDKNAQHIPSFLARKSALAPVIIEDDKTEYIDPAIVEAAIKELAAKLSGNDARKVS